MSSASVFALSGMSHHRMMTSANGVSMCFIDATDIMAYTRVHRTDPMHGACRSSILQPFLTEMPQFYYNRVHQVLDRRFKGVVEKYWGSRLCTNIIDTLCVLGVLPVTLLELPDGTKVPHVLQLGTYSLGIYHSPLAESQCYVVYRTHLAGASMLGQRKIGRLTDDSGDQMFNNGGAGGFFLGPTDPGIAKLLNGPRYLDDREIMTRRLDMGELFPELGQPDPCVVVLDGFGSDPMLDGTLTSVIARTFPMFLELQVQRKLHLVQEQRIAVEQPFVEVPQASPEYINRVGIASVPPRGVGDINASDGSVRQAVRSEAEIRMYNAMMREQQEQNQSMLAQSTLPSAVITSDLGADAAMRSLSEFSAYAQSTNFQRAAGTAYTLVQPGGKVVSHHPQKGGQNLIQLTTETNERIAAAYGIPMSQYHVKATSHSDASTQQGSKHETMHLYLNTVSRVLTHFYDIIYGESTMQTELSFLYERFLSEEAIERLLRHFDAVEDKEWDQLLLKYAQWQQQREAMLQLSDRGHWEGVGKLHKGSLSNVGDKRITTHHENRMRRHGGSVGDSYEDQGAAPGADQTSSSSSSSESDSDEDGDPHVPETLDEILQEPNRQLARFGLRRLFLREMERAPNTVIRLFENGDQWQKQWITTEGHSKAMTRANDAMRQSGVVVTFPYSAGVTSEELDRMYALGKINKHEWLQMGRSAAMLPVQCDTGDALREPPIEKWSDYAASDHMTKIMKETPIGGVVSSMQTAEGKEKQRIEQERKEAEKAREAKRKGTAAPKKRKPKSAASSASKRKAT